MSVFGIVVTSAKVSVAVSFTYPEPMSQESEVNHASDACFPASPEVRAEVSALSVFRLEKFVFTCHLNDAPVIQSFNVVIVDIGLN